MTYAIYSNRSTCFLVGQKIVDHFPHYSKMEYPGQLKGKGNQIKIN